MAQFFPRDRLSKSDYAIASVVVGICYLSFIQNADMQRIGLASLNYLFGAPLDFYDNARKFWSGGDAATAYPPSIYMIFALWLYPFKILGIITGPERFELHLVYWLKALTTFVYAASAIIFYDVLREYGASKEWAKYGAIVWLTMPLALFVQFIFTQIDIFYVLLTLVGFLMFLRGNVYRASILFGLAVTFKYFPAFAFAPLLFLYEKRIPRIVLCWSIFAIPSLIIYLLYSESSGFLYDVHGHWTLKKIYAASIPVDEWRIYLLFAAFATLCGLAYFHDVARSNQNRVAAYIWLVASVLPFAFIRWHPQWVMSCTPAIVLTSMIDQRFRKFMLLDLVGMAVFVVTSALAYPNNVDASMFQGQLLGFDFENSYPMGLLFTWFDSHSTGVFFSCFVAYLSLQAILKYTPLLQQSAPVYPDRMDYGLIRQRFYFGLLIFLVPVSYSIYRGLS